MIKIEHSITKHLEEGLKLQEELGYPKFKKRIARTLQAEYGLDFEQSMHLVYSQEIEEKINSDIEWAQHMGSEFWAKEIYNNFLT
ncbi:hypothetical protein QNH44_24990 [Cytobacillus firmus]|uniref:hypothetical protein n=1 Tax=Cytobacillus firmus TaxID=1399 RepID=UPI0024C19FBA|nr:hypothetical protein [Cytobacillus firmus]WHY34221.1 hypothetical protein QNH44_24990 [Cytobacillus firmus]